MDSLRVSELARELNLTSKDVIEKFAEISIVVKSHSNTVTPDQIRKLKEHLGFGIPKNNVKPKAFIVKKSKSNQEESPKEETSKPTKPTTPQIERIQKVQKAPKIEKIEKAEKTTTTGVQEEIPVIKKAEKPQVKIERTKIEYKNQSRIEIVRKAPTSNNPAGKNKNRDGKLDERGERKPFNKPAGDKKLVERRIIPQEIYEGKGGPSKRRNDGGKKKEKDCNSKK